jgi:hypothetical protein
MRRRWMARVRAARAHSWRRSPIGRTTAKARIDTSIEESLMMGGYRGESTNDGYKKEEGIGEESRADGNFKSNGDAEGGQERKECGTENGESP